MRRRPCLNTGLFRASCAELTYECIIRLSYVFFYFIEFTPLYTIFHIRIKWDIDLKIVYNTQWLPLYSLYLAVMGSGYLYSSIMYLKS